jgi:hypothetical protein
MNKTECDDLLDLSFWEGRLKTHTPDFFYKKKVFFHWKIVPANVLSKLFTYLAKKALISILSLMRLKRLLYCA